MSKLTCSCLNIRLYIQESPTTLTPHKLNLTPIENSHPFFTKDVWLVTLSIGGISEGQVFLVKHNVLGSWTIHECINCHTFTHATKSPSEPVAANTLLISDNHRIEELQKSESYSPVFNFILPTSIDNRPLPPNSPTDFTNNRLPETEEALRAIQQQMSKFLKRAESQAEANIRTYTDKQQTALAALQVRARRDRQTLMRMLSSVQANRSSSPDPIDTFEMEGAYGRGANPFSEPHRIPRGFEEVEECEEAEGWSGEVADEFDGALPPLPTSQPLAMQGITSGMRGMRLSSSVAVPKMKPQGNVRVAQSLDVEGLFDMEGMMDSEVMPPPPQPIYHDDDDDDIDDPNHDEGIHIPRNRLPSRDLAQSVPVNVPMWPTATAAAAAAAAANITRDPMIIERPKDSSEMAASIQALARSVHTTSVDLFGDLPRPRQPT